MALRLRKRGITRVRPLHGGLDGWRRRGLPVTGGAAPTAEVSLRGLEPGPAEPRA